MFKLSVLHCLELSFSSVYVVQPITHWGKGTHTVGLSCPVQMAARTERHSPRLHPVCWEHQGIQSLTCSCMVSQDMVLQKIYMHCLPFLSIQCQLLCCISRRARLSYEKNMCERISAACFYFNTKGCGTKTLKGNKPFGL